MKRSRVAARILNAGCRLRQYRHEARPEEGYRYRGNRLVRAGHAGDCGAERLVARGGYHQGAGMAQTCDALQRCHGVLDGAVRSGSGRRERSVRASCISFAGRLAPFADVASHLSPVNSRSSTNVPRSPSNSARRRSNSHRSATKSLGVRLEFHLPCRPRSRRRRRCS
jgi:hypothetical protein